MAESTKLSNTSNVTEMDACGDIENPSVTPNLLIENDCYGVTSKIEEAVGDTVEVEI